MREVAIFASADDRYVPASVMALRSFQRWFPGCGYFLLGTRAAMSPASLKLLSRFDIELIDVNEAARFRRSVHTPAAYAPECFYVLKGPELLAERYRYSLSVDGDVFCARRFDLRELFRRIDGVGGRPVGTLWRALHNKQREGHTEFDFAARNVRAVLGLDESTLNLRYEFNTGVLAWNNVAMAERRLFEKVVAVFARCKGCFESDQDLLAFTAASHGISFAALDDSYNFSFFEDSHVPGPDPDLDAQVRRGRCDRVRIVHFVFCKPWTRPIAPNAVKAHFINAWRRFVLAELGARAEELFEDLSEIRVRYPIGPFWNCLRAVRAFFERRKRSAAVERVAP